MDIDWDGVTAIVIVVYIIMSFVIYGLNKEAGEDARYCLARAIIWPYTVWQWRKKENISNPKDKNTKE